MEDCCRTVISPLWLALCDWPSVIGPPLTWRVDLLTGGAQPALRPSVEVNVRPSGRGERGQRRLHRAGSEAGGEIPRPDRHAPLEGLQRAQEPGPRTPDSVSDPPPPTTSTFTSRSSNNDPEKQISDEGLMRTQVPSIWPSSFRPNNVLCPSGIRSRRHQADPDFPVHGLPQVPTSGHPGGLLILTRCQNRLRKVVEDPGSYVARVIGPWSPNRSRVRLQTKRG